MEVRLAEHAGFCFGVKRAVEICTECAAGAGKVYTYGPIIHNEAVVGSLREQGVDIITEETALTPLEKGTVIIRAHGVVPEVYDKLEMAGFAVVDATCPFVKKIHRAVANYSARGYHIIVTGGRSHPEVQGICGYCVHEKIDVVENVEDLENLRISADEQVLVVSQTTFHRNKFKDLVEIIKKKDYNKRVCILNTICSATEERQNEALQLSREVDGVIVIGSTASSNTRKLYEICAANCPDTFLIQGLSELRTAELAGLERIGITAGASTPNNIIQEVSRYVRDEL